jgi:dolichyl-diphosphooligosaccharide--protein glycosyltransferase
LLQLIFICEHPAFLKLFKLDPATITRKEKLDVYAKVFGVGALIVSVVVALLWPTGYFGPLSSRVRGLFVTHTRTGNPLVDSVAEHQPASSAAFWQFLHFACFTAPVGFAVCVYKCVILPFFRPRKEGEGSNDPLFFLIMYALVSYHFSTKMNRLMLLMGAISSALSGISIGVAFDFVWSEAGALVSLLIGDEKVKAVEEPEPATDNKGSKQGKDKKSKDTTATQTIPEMIEKKVSEINNLSLVKILKKILAVCIVYWGFFYTQVFYHFCSNVAVGMSNPSIMFQARLHDGTTIIVDDYREAYWWLRDNTPEDSRVMAWWDYGYQITGIGNRTTIADGNTWNHEVNFIALV